MSKQLKRYYQPKAAGQVLGSLMKEPHRLNNQDQRIEGSDFLLPLHQVVFYALKELADQGATSIRPVDVIHHLEPHASTFAQFEKQKGKEFVQHIYDTSEIGMYDYYYDRLRKLACLRAFITAGVDIKFLLNYDEIDPVMLEQQEQAFFKLSLTEILNRIDERFLQAKESFVSKGVDEGKVGEYVDLIEEELKETKPYGFSFESELFNTATRGFRSGAYYVESLETSGGKTRKSIKRLMLISAPRYWCFKTKQFIDNPHGKGRATLYINSEMTRKELDTMLVPFIAGVEEDKWIEGWLNQEERERIEIAKQIAKETPIYVVVEENFDISFLDFTINKYKTLHQIQAVIFDYIELTSALSAEFTKLSKISLREDMVLLNLSSKLKHMARQYEVAIFSYTQVNDEARENNRGLPRRDAGAVKGGKSIANKADLGVVSMVPTQKEQEVIEQLMSARAMLCPKPNLVMNLYKVRGTKYKLVRLFVWQNLGNMEVIDCFATSWDYQLIDLPKTQIRMENKPFIKCKNDDLG